MDKDVPPLQMIGISISRPLQQKIIPASICYQNTEETQRKNLRALNRYVSMPSELEGSRCLGAFD